MTILVASRVERTGTAPMPRSTVRPVSNPAYLRPNQGAQSTLTNQETAGHSQNGARHRIVSQLRLISRGRRHAGSARHAARSQQTAPTKWFFACRNRSRPRRDRDDAWVCPSRKGAPLSFGAAVAEVPVIALVGSYEMLMIIVR